MATTTVRMSEKTCRELRKLAKESGETMQSVAEKAVMAYRKKRFFEELNREFKALREDPIAWEEELAERRLWEKTLMDGLDPNERWDEVTREPIEG